MKIKKIVSSTLIVGSLFSNIVLADGDYENRYILVGSSLDFKTEKTMQGINLEYSWIDYKQHYKKGKHSLSGVGLKFNNDEDKFGSKAEDVREMGVYGKKGFELSQNSNIYGLGSLGLGYLTSKDSLGDKEVDVYAEAGLGVGYYSKDGDYAISLEYLGYHYEQDGYHNGARLMVGWKL